MPTTRTKPSRPKMSPEARRAYADVERGVRSLGKAIVEIRQGLRKAERQIEADARARVRALRNDARAQVAALESRRREASQPLRRLASAAGGSWDDLKQSVDTIVSEGRAAAASVIERFRSALGR
jgi:hypothetical protein